MAGGDHVAGAGTRGGPREVPQRVADELRSLIVSGELSEGESLGREPDLVERFGVSRPSLREALRILEAEGLITVERGVRGGVVAHEPDKRMTARTAALLLRSRNVSLADVFEARSLLEPVAARKIAGMPSRGRKAATTELGALIDAQEEVIEDPEAISLIKRQLDDSALLTFEQAVEAEALVQHVTYTTSDVREGITAFLERRDPRFTGR
jgi:GntR family transcriptional regulator, transcriptional repressor for pyruvate dehydrogenase complex